MECSIPFAHIELILSRPQSAQSRSIQIAAALSLFFFVGSIQAALVPLTGITQIATGAAHTCAQLQSGTVQCWGANGSGLLGNFGDSSDYNLSPSPGPVVGLRNVSAIAAGGAFNCALLVDASVQCWGSDDFGELGDGGISNIPALTAVKSFGKVTAIGAGAEHACALLYGGAVQCWGDNFYGEIGTGALLQDSRAPTLVNGLANAKTIALGDGFTCAIANGGSVKCFGRNSQGQLGNGSTNDSASPTTVVGITNAIAIAAGDMHVCAILGNRTTYCWGYNYAGQLGNDNLAYSNPVPVQVNGVSGAVSLAAGTNHTCALLDTGVVQCWGADDYGQLGDGANDAHTHPVTISNILNAISISARGNHTCVLLSTGTAQCWGDNSWWQLGNGAIGYGSNVYSNVPLPVLVPGPSAATITSDANPSFYSSGVTLSAKVLSASATGYVGFYEDDELLCPPVELDGNSSATCRDALPIGTHIVTAIYYGDAVNATAIATLTQIVLRDPTTTALASSANPGAIDQAILLTASVSAGTGSMTFKDGSNILCEAVPLNSMSTAYCVASFETTGFHSITASYSGDSLNANSASTLVQVITKHQTFDPNQFGLTGAWYNQATSGQGFLINTLQDPNASGTGLLFAGWFTYDLSGNPRWYSLQGTISQDVSVTPLTIYENVGGNFNALPKTTAMAIGTATLDFADCTHATLRYSFNKDSDHSGSQNGLIPLSRVIQPAHCAANGDVDTTPDDTFLSGTWYNADTSGQGFVFDISPTNFTLFGAWYTFARNGSAVTDASSQRWFTIQTQYFNTYRNVFGAAIYSTSNGIFDTPKPITISQVGSADITFISCSSMQLHYEFTAGEMMGQAGTISMQRAGPVPENCQ